MSVLRAAAVLAPALLLAGGACPAAALAGDTIVTHGLSPFGELKYPPDFPHFDYVNPAAPKGGVLSTSGSTAVKTFDSFNAFILKGDAPEGVVLNGSDGGSLIWDSLLVSAGDEPDAAYGLVAWQIEYPPDRRWVIFRLRPEARFHDGSPLTAEDVKFSLEILKEKGDPRIIVPLQEVEAVEALGPHELKVSFKAGANTRDLPRLIGGYPVLSRAWYATRDFGASSLEKPLSSGPYRIGDFKQGAWIEYQRVPDYWAKDLPVNVGRWNFDRIRYEFYRDRNIDFEAFKSHQYTLREEFTAKTWAMEYDFPAVQDGRVIKVRFQDENPSGVQGFFLNTRRAKFADPRVRKALDYAFDYEWMNRTIFHGQYQRTASFFENSPELRATGLPGPAELELLEPLRALLPASVFGPAYVPPTTDGSGLNRANLRNALGLLEEAGWRVIDGRLRNAAGEPFEIEFFDFDMSSQRFVLPYFQNLKVLGISASLRQVDAPQYERRRKDYDFDITMARYSQQNTPGVELRNYFGSAYADVPGGWNLSGIRDPAVDALIEQVIAAGSRAELLAAVNALDRVLRAGHYWIPQWYSGTHRIAYWDEFGMPERRPRFMRGILDTWWAKSAEPKEP